MAWAQFCLGDGRLAVPNYLRLMSHATCFIETTINKKMIENESNYPVQEELRLFMEQHGIETIEELLTYTNEVLFAMEGITMHIMDEVYKLKLQKRSEE